MVYDDQPNIHHSRASKGTSAEAAERRLRKDRPDLHARVRAGEISPRSRHPECFA
jgi:hypothetical protein